jgi:hypothetical protein
VTEKKYYFCSEHCRGKFLSKPSEEKLSEIVKAGRVVLVGGMAVLLTRLAFHTPIENINFIKYCQH